MNKGAFSTDESDYVISESTWKWTYFVLKALEKSLSVNVALHGDHQLLESGQIFLFNHFSRFETFIPQYLIYRQTGCYSRSIAGAEFFKGDTALSSYLRAVGAVPNRHPRLLPFLAEEILKGRKVIIFPEGGMVKDRQVIDQKGDYSVYSRSADRRRKHHSGAAVLGLTLAAFKTGIRALDKAGDHSCIEEWAERLGMESSDALLQTAHQYTEIIPSNITFYPIRVGSNFIQRSAELFDSELSDKITEELLVEGNMILEDTDMDIRMAAPIHVAKRWHWWEHRLMRRLLHRVNSFDEMFYLGPDLEQRRNWIISLTIGRQVTGLRDRIMEMMYQNVTLNLSHLASWLILQFVESGELEVDSEQFHLLLYQGIKGVQESAQLNLHNSLSDPGRYSGLLEKESPPLRQFLDSEAVSGLVEQRDGIYRFSKKIGEPSDFDEIRLENLIAVYANEMAPVGIACQVLSRVFKKRTRIDQQQIAALRFDDLTRTYKLDRQYYSTDEFDAINREETATADGSPFFFISRKPSPLGVVIVHGLLASPAEVRECGERLHAAGFHVIGVRLKGHGTSPWDLREQSWEQWQHSVVEGYEIISAYCERIVLVGFSTGGNLSLLLAAEHDKKLAGVVTVSAPLGFQNRNLIFVPLLHGANQMVSWLSSLEGIKPFVTNESEHPSINYRNTPIRALYELQQLMELLKSRLDEVTCPVLIIQSEKDHVIDPQSADTLFAGLGSEKKSLIKVASERHGILNENIGGTQEAVIDFVSSLSPSAVE